MKRKMAAILLAGTMAFSLAACGDTQESGGTQNAGNQEKGDSDQAQADLDLENIYDLYVTWPSLGSAPKDFQMIEDAVNEICEANIGVHVVLQPIALSELTSQQQLLISSGEKMDVICMLWTGLDTWVNTESVLELEDLIPAYGAGIVDMMGDAAYGASYDGHVYGISTEDSGYPYGFLCRTDMLEKYGYPTEDRAISIEELEDIFATVKEGEGKSYYCVASGGSFQCLDGRYDLLGGSMYTGALMLDEDTDTIVNMMETDAYRDYAYRMYDWAQKGYISPDAATTEDSAQVLLTTGNYLGAFVYVGSGTKISYGSAGTIPLTALEIQPGYTTTGDLMNVIFGVASTCEQPEKAVAFLNELYTNSELSDLLSHGIEGVHYVVADQNDKGQKIIEYPEGVDMSTSGYVCALGVWATGTSCVWAPETYDFFEEREERRQFERSPAFGYVFSSTDYSTELTALSAVYNEYSRIIDCGAIHPDDELPAFIEALKGANIDVIIEANQAQYDQWKSEQ